MDEKKVEEWHFLGGKENASATVKIESPAAGLVCRKIDGLLQQQNRADLRRGRNWMAMAVSSVVPHSSSSSRQQSPARPAGSPSVSSAIHSSIFAQGERGPLSPYAHSPTFYGRHLQKNLFLSLRPIFCRIWHRRRNKANFTFSPLSHLLSLFISSIPMPLALSFVHV